jgi:hypothetical protein
MPKGTPAAGIAAAAPPAVAARVVLAVLEGSAVFQERFRCQLGQMWLAVADSVGWVVTYIAAGYADAALAPSEHWIAHTMSLEERSQLGSGKFRPTCPIVRSRY